MYLNIFNSTNRLVIEFRNAQLRLLVGSFNKNQLIINKYFSIDLPNDVYNNGEILDFGQLSYVIKRNLQVNKIKIKNTHILLDSDKIIIREIVIPLADEKNYEEFLEYHLEDYLPIENNEYVIKYLVVDSIINHDYTRILVTAAPRKLVNDFHRLISDLGLKPLVFDTVGNCISKFLFHNEEFGLVATIGIDFSRTNVLISNFGQLRYSKTLEIGYKNILEYLNDFEIDKFELMDILSLDQRNEPQFNAQINIANNIFQMELLKEIELVIKYFLREQNIGSIYLYEEYSKTYNIEEIFSDYFNCYCNKLDALSDIEFKGDILSYANTVGGLIRL